MSLSSLVLSGLGGGATSWNGRFSVIGERLLAIYFEESPEALTKVTAFDLRDPAQEAMTSFCSLTVCPSQAAPFIRRSRKAQVSTLPYEVESIVVNWRSRTERY